MRLGLDDLTDAHMDQLKATSPCDWPQVLEAIKAEQIEAAGARIDCAVEHAMKFTTPEEMR
jgi:hypothetical protein